MNIADRLSSLMRWRGIRSQRHLARLSGVPQTSIHRILADRPGYAPSYSTVGKLAYALSVSPDWLRGDEHAMRIRPPAIALPPRPPRPSQRGDDDVAEMKRLMATLTAAERRKIVAVVRLIAQGRLPSTLAAGAARQS
jgi:transcriptional regulator with XRE-family HTH domain